MNGIWLFYDVFACNRNLRKIVITIVIELISGNKKARDFINNICIQKKKIAIHTFDAFFQTYISLFKFSEI